MSFTMERINQTSRTNVGTTITSKQSKKGMKKAAPPNLYTKNGNRQKLPETKEMRTSAYSRQSNR